MNETIAETTSDERQTLPELRFRLPGAWQQVRLDDPETARADVKALIERQVGRQDERAALRGELRAALTDRLQSAVESGAIALFVALEIEGLPLSAYYTVYLPAQPISGAVGTSADAVAGVFETGLRQADPGATVVRVASEESIALRTHRHQAVDVPTEEGEPQRQLDTLVVDYWLTVPDTKRVVLVSFATALGGIEEIMLDLFDAIIEVSYWVR
ncbi:hypothetical protein [Protaetiibacter intestinalis]|uniref:Uncharacterized protein n=1 Tax=Protaetiibacter intestinalis TaxID=2419774 RepID=A0A387BBJ3_9MICO|nr:hypothetical protein [Protaetiibacter intestinalis]AYF98526.1 hypothetical protein D7I47_09810 [Protaetiibacter intestinalis]